MTAGRSRRETVYRSAIAAGKVLPRALDVDVRSDGQEHVSTTGPVVLATNHVSFPDFVFVQQALLANRLVRFMCRADIWDTALPGTPIGWAMQVMGRLPRSVLGRECR